MNPHHRETLAKSRSLAAPIRIVLHTLPWWGLSMLLLLFMPITGFISAIIMAICLFILPFKARYGHCPQCRHGKLFPFSGFGYACKGCGQELVLRGRDIHLLEAKKTARKAGLGRG
ncbi:MAG: hypothetical protein R8M45_01325 [Ghiorsea sp.]